jgi:sulfite reductase (NADPH) hemoprotein beta-component
VDWFREQVEERLGFRMEEAREFSFSENGDRYGWFENEDGTFNFTFYVPGGRVQDTAGSKQRTGFLEIARILDGEFRLTGNQNLTIAKISVEQRPQVEGLIAEHGLNSLENLTGLRLNSISCVALPTCGLALAEAERFLPDVITELDEVIEAVGLRHDAITIRMTGCPNGCARPYIAEIAFVGRSPGKYNVYLGGGFVGDRLSKLWRVRVKSEEIKDLLEPVIEDYAKSREEGERFGDFVIRKGYVKATSNGLDFHSDVVLPEPAAKK